MKELHWIPAFMLAALLVPVSAIPAPTLQPSKNGRYLQWSDGTPVFFLSDTAWLLPARFSAEEVAEYVAARKKQGFTAIQMTACFPENGYQDISKIFADSDLAQPVPAYWEMMDAKVKQVTDAGLIAILNPFWKKTSHEWLKTNGPAKCRAYGKWFAARYRQNPRVAYFIGGDSAPEPVREAIHEMGAGLQDAYLESGLPPAIVSYHGKPGQTSREAFPAARWVTLNWIYDYAPPLGKRIPVQDAWADWGRAPAMPMQFGEGFYDRGDLAGSRFGDRFMCRRQAWWAVLGGCLAGYAYGAEPVWLHGYKKQTWRQAIAYESGHDVARLKAFLTAREWWKLQPDLGNEFLTAGFGSPGTMDFAVAAVASDQAFAVVYSPMGLTLSLKMPRGTSPYSLEWFDPSDGTTQPSPIVAMPGTTVAATPPGRNAHGKQDWVLLVTISKR